LHSNCQNCLICIEGLRLDVSADDDAGCARSELP